MNAGGEQQVNGVSVTFEALRKELQDLKLQDEALLNTIQKLRAELRLAGLIQRDLFRSPLPELTGATVRALHRPAGEVSGDVYQIVRLDDSHVAIAVADATGHGVSAALLSVFIQRSLAGLNDRPQQRLRPEAVLTRLNQDILAADLQECHFVSAVYAVYNEDTRAIRLARAGAPYPVLFRTGEPPRPIKSEGMLLGVRPDAYFEPTVIRLQEGDSVVFHTDGLDPYLSAPSHGTSSWGESWFAGLGDAVWDRRMTELDDHIHSKAPSTKESDDVTVIALHVADSPQPVECLPARTRQSDISRSLFSSASGGRM